MVTAAFRHCLLNRIALEIMVGVIYLCNSPRLVIVHVGISCRICFLLSKGRKEHALYWKWPAPTRASISSVCILSGPLWPGWKLYGVVSCMIEMVGEFELSGFVQEHLRISLNIFFSYTISCPVQISQRKWILLPGWRGDSRFPPKDVEGEVEGVTGY